MFCADLLCFCNVAEDWGIPLVLNPGRERPSKFKLSFSFYVVLVTCTMVFGLKGNAFCSSNLTPVRCSW